jgi:pimeloyl-ACP methyl ester carboxylesterase
VRGSRQDRLLVLPEGRALELLELGDPAGRPVFFLPGCPDSRWAAWSAREVAADVGVRLLAVNRPGYGRSTATASTHRSVADDLVSAMDQLGVGAAGVLGMSLGGPYALACAALHPARVTAVTTVSAVGQVAAMDPPHHRDDLAPEAVSELAAVRRGTLADAVEVLRPAFERWAASFDAGEVPDEQLASRWAATSSGRDLELLLAVPPDVRARGAREALADPTGYLRDAALALRAWEWDIDAVRCPVSVWHGGSDDSASVRNAEWLLTHVPGARGEVLPGETHLAVLHDHWRELLETLDGAGGTGQS